MSPKQTRLIGTSIIMGIFTGCATPTPSSRWTSPAPSQAAIPPILPRPAAVEPQAGTFTVSASTTLLFVGTDPQVKTVADYFADVLRPATGYPLRARPIAAPSPIPAGAIVLQMDSDATALGPEGYHLLIAPDSMELRAATPQGLFWAVQTVRQLLPPECLRADAPARKSAPVTLPCLRISDRPRYSWRGMHLDVGRHMFPVAFIKRYIDLLALHKINAFHWHLTEDQGWRIEIRAYPKLTSVGAWRQDGDNRYGGFYTQQDVRDVVAYAASRFVTVVPEIEMPGHALAALAAYPELSCTGGPFEVTSQWGVFDDVYCAGNEETFQFLDRVLAEVAELFPAPYVHVGGDECPKARWSQCPLCQARIKAEGLANEHELQSYFIHRAERILQAKGKRLIGWDEILEGGLAPDATVMSWRGTTGGIDAARQGHDVIMTPTSHCYFNFWQVSAPDEPGHPQGKVISLQDVYAFEPTPTELTAQEARHVLGAQGNVWTEYILTDRDVEYMALPRMCALAEVTWTPADLRDWQDFSRRMEVHRRRLDALGVNYCPKDLPAPP